MPEEWNINAQTVIEVLAEAEKAVVAFGNLGLVQAANTFTEAQKASIYGASDEFHQIFEPARKAELSDVGLDSIGAAIAIILFIIFLKGRMRKLLYESSTVNPISTVRFKR